jgi:hypothetical protein
MNQHTFAAALRDPGGDPPAGLRVREGCDLRKRFDVYRNNHFASLVATLAEGFPVCRALVGEDFFREMARCFVRDHPPRSPVLTEYGRGLPAFIDGFAPAATVPYLADMARLEQLRIDAWHAADATPLARGALENALSRAQALPGARLQLHPSVAVLRSRYALFDLWMAHQGEVPIESVQPIRAQCVMVLRPRDAVNVALIGEPTAVFVQALASGLPLGAAMEAAFEAQELIDAGTVLTELLRSEALVAIEFPSESSDDANHPNATAP